MLGSTQVSTSRPTPAEFAAVYRSLGVAQVVSVHLSAELSGTYDAAVLAAGEVGGDDIAVRVVDSRMLAMGLGFVVVAAAEAAAFGAMDRVRYRRRATNEGLKAGNLREFAQAACGTYELMVVLDADSLMSGGAIVRMVRVMQAAPRIGVQVAPRIDAVLAGHSSGRRESNPRHQLGRLRFYL